MTEKILCPVMGCKWEMDSTPPEVGPGALADMFGWGVFEATAKAQHSRKLEVDIERHLKTHSVLEWATTVQELRNLNLSLVQQLAEMGEAVQRVAEWVHR